MATVPVDDSDMENEVGSPAAGQKRKQQSSPAPALDMAALRDMFQAQTLALQKSQDAQLKSAIEGLEARSQKRLDGLERSLLDKFRVLDDKLAKTDAAVEDLTKQNAALSDRISLLEKGGVSSAHTTATDKKLNTVVLGGWPRDTKREVIVADAKQIVERLGLQGRLEQPFWCPGVRGSVALSNFVQMPGEDADGLRARMIHVVTAISGAKLAVDPGQQTSKLYWCTLSKPRQERLRSSHASKVRRLMYALKLDMGKVETEYASGTVWLMDKCISSATRPSSPDGVLDEVRSSWEACFSN